jgi:TetR/AcrR family transcriptional repressor of mexJK operon
MATRVPDVTTTLMPRMKRATARRSKGRPRLEDVRAIEKRLLAIALEEFQKHGYGGASVNAIAAAAGASKTTLYSRYPDKASLFRAIMHAQIEQLAGDPVPGISNTQPQLAAGLRAYANHMLDLSFKGELLEINRLVYSESQRFPELGAAAAERGRLGIEQIANFIERCAGRDGIPCRDPESVAEVFIFMIRGWYINVMLTNLPVPSLEREKWVRRAVQVLVAGRKDW